MRKNRIDLGWKPLSKSSNHPALYASIMPNFKLLRIVKTIARYRGAVKEPGKFFPDLDPLIFGVRPMNQITPNEMTISEIPFTVSVNSCC